MEDVYRWVKGLYLSRLYCNYFMLNFICLFDMYVKTGCGHNAYFIIILYVIAHIDVGILFPDPK